jgi:hypothetical protein
MSTSSPVRTRRTRRPSTPPQAGSDRSPRGESESVAVVVRSILLAVAAVSVLATSNYFAYLIGRKQVTYEELRRQVDLVVQLVNQKRVENERASTALKQRQDRLEQNASDLTGLTTSTIKGKTTAVAPEPAPAARPIPAAPIDAAPVAQPDREVSLQPPESSPNAMAKHGEMSGVAQQHGSRRQKVSAPRRGPAAAAFAEQPGQLTSAPSATPDVGLAGQ